MEPDYLEIIRKAIEKQIETAHSVLLSMSVDKENLSILGIYKDEVREDFERIQNRLIGIYDSHQELLRFLPVVIKPKIQIEEENNDSKGIETSVGKHSR